MTVPVAARFALLPLASLVGVPGYVTDDYGSKDMI